MSTGLLVAVGAVGFEAALLQAAAGPQFHVVRRCVDVPDLVATAASRQATAALVSAQLRGLDSEIVARLREEGVAVIGVTPESSSADEAVLRRLGVDQILSADDMGSFADAVAAAQHRATSPSPDSGPSRDRHGSGAPGDAAQEPGGGQVIAVWGPTGAPGRSVLSLCLAAELAASGTATLLVDADVYGGAVAAMLGLLDESSGLLAAARAANSGALRPDGLASQAREVNATLRVLTGIPRADRWTELTAPLLRNVVETARRLCAFTVLDCGFSLELDEEISYDTAAPRRNGATLEALSEADTLVVVGGADPVSLSRLIRGLNDLSESLPGLTPYVVVNRVRGSLGWSEDEIAATVTRATGVSSIRMLPDDPAACDKALVHGRTLTECAPEAKITKAVRAMAADLAGLTAPARRPTGPRLGRLRRR